MRYIVQRALSAFVVLFFASIFIFFLLRLAPGDPALTLAGPDASAETVAAIRTQLGLDETLLSQYLLWLSGILSGDLGNSFILHAPIAELIEAAIGNTVVLASAALILALVFTALMGITLGVTQRKSVASVVGALNALIFAVPTYVTGVLLVLIFAVTLRLLPPGGVGPGWSDPGISIQYLILPAFTLSLPTAAILSRFLAAALRRTADEDFIHAARAKGLSSGRLFRRHTFPNSVPSVLTIFGLQLGQLLSGAIIVETIFAWPGLGQLLLQSVISRDFLLTQDLLLLAVTVFIVLQIATDVVDASIDPRVRLEGA